MSGFLLTVFPNYLLEPCSLFFFFKKKFWGVCGKSNLFCCKIVSCILPYVSPTLSVFMLQVLFLCLHVDQYCSNS